MEKHIAIERHKGIKGCTVLVKNASGKDILAIGTRSYAAARRIKTALSEGAWLVAGPNRR